MNGLAPIKSLGNSFTAPGQNDKDAEEETDVVARVLEINLLLTFIF